MRSFTYSANPARVIFGSGTFSKLPEEISKLGIRRPLVLSTPEQKDHANKVEEILKSNAGETQCAGQFNGATMHTPMEVTLRALDFVRETKADGVISIGGGSTTGLGKALVLQSYMNNLTPLKHISIPTTYAGSEMTPILGQTSNNEKQTINDPRVLPHTVIYDVQFTLTLPPAMSATSGLNALAHAIEALYSQSANPIIDLVAEEGIRALASSLPIIIQGQDGVEEARSEALYGAYLSATCLGHVGMSLHHKLCHVLGGTFNLPHAETHAIVLPHALAYNAPSLSPIVMSKIARALNVHDGQDAVEGLNDLLRKLNVKRALKDLSPGMPEEGVEKAADRAVKNPYWNPRPVEKAAIKEIIRRAWSGEDARADV